MTTFGLVPTKWAKNDFQSMIVASLKMLIVLRCVEVNEEEGSVPWRRRSNTNVASQVHVRWDLHAYMSKDLAI